MKRVLLASTALMMVAGAAAADVKFSGYQRFGIKYVEDRDLLPDGTRDTSIDETEITSRFRLNIDVTTETDQGVKLEARVRMQADEGGTAGLNGARFSAAAAGLRVDIGNIAGAIDNMPNYYGYEIGLTDFLGQYNGNDYSFDGYSSTGAGQDGLYARYAFGAWAIAASYSDDDVSDEEGSIHIAYTGANWGVALGYADGDTITTPADPGDPGATPPVPPVAEVSESDTYTVLTGNYDFGTVDVTAYYGDSKITDASYGLSANIEIGAATSIQVAWGDGDLDNADAYGIGFKQNIGGGAFLRGGVGKVNDGTTADLGVRFDF